MCWSFTETNNYGEAYMLKEIPRKEINRFRSWMKNQPEAKRINQYIPVAEQETLMAMLWERYQKEKPDKTP